MTLVSGSQRKMIISLSTLKKIMILSVMASAVAMVGCASKPQINNQARYASAPNYYTVRSGDTLSGIAARYGLNYLSIAQINDISAPYTIYVGQSLRLKNGNAPKTANTTALSQNTPIQRQKIDLPSNTQTQTVKPATTAKIPTPSVTTSNQLKWVKPSNGSILAQFNPSADIKGIRYGGKVGDPVYAAANGQVVYAADGLKEYGNLVLVKHIDGYITAYAHNSKMLVQAGQNVVAGQKIAELGTSGVTSPMLEFQVRLNGKPINPQIVLTNP